MSGNLFDAVTDRIDDGNPGQPAFPYQTTTLARMVGGKPVTKIVRSVSTAPGSGNGRSPSASPGCIDASSRAQRLIQGADDDRQHRSGRDMTIGNPDQQAGDEIAFGLAGRTGYRFASALAERRDRLRAG